MLVRISDISWHGLPVRGSLSLEPLNARMGEGSGNIVTFTGPPLVDLLVLRTQGGAEVKGQLTARYTQECGYCLDPIERVIELKPHFFLKHRPSAQEGGRDEEYIDDVGVYFYTGDHFDFEQPLQELLILTISPFWTPGCGTDGHCLHCKAIPPTKSFEGSGGTNNLGKLLAAAAERKNTPPKR